MRLNFVLHSQSVSKMAFKVAFFVFACSAVILAATVDSRPKRQTNPDQQNNNTNNNNNEPNNATQNLANVIADNIAYQANSVQNSLDSVNDLIQQKFETCRNLTRTFTDLVFAFPRFKLGLLGANRRNNTG